MAKRKKKLKGMNLQRAMWAEIGVIAFRNEVGTDDVDLLCDLLCDLMHFSDLRGFDFEREFLRGRDHYNYEKRHQE